MGQRRGMTHQIAVMWAALAVAQRPEAREHAKTVFCKFW